MSQRCDICSTTIPPDAEHTVMFAIPGNGVERIVTCSSATCCAAALTAAGHVLGQFFRTARESKC